MGRILLQGLASWRSCCWFVLLVWMGVSSMTLQPLTSWTSMARMKLPVEVMVEMSSAFTLTVVPQHTAATTIPCSLSSIRTLPKQGFVWQMVQPKRWMQLVTFKYMLKMCMASSTALHFTMFCTFPPFPLTLIDQEVLERQQDQSKV